MKTLVIIPAFNEEACIKNTIEHLKTDAPELDFVVINDGSKDKTKQICEAEEYPCVTLPVNGGLACAFQTGVKYAKTNGYDSVLQFDADGQHLASYIPLMQKAMIDTEADVVIASRFLEEKKPRDARGMGSRLITKLIQLTTGVTIHDPTSGMRLFNRSIIDQFSGGFDITPEPDTLALFIRKGAKIVEIPATMQERQGGNSYFTLPSIVAYMSRTCFSLLLFQWFR